MSMKAIFKGVIIAFIITFAVMLVAAALLCFTELGEGTAGMAVYAGTALGIIVGAVKTARSAGRKTLFHCLALAVIYLIVMALVTFFTKGEIIFNYHFWAVTAGVVACSVFGAVVGRTNV